MDLTGRLNFNFFNDPARRGNPGGNTPSGPLRESVIMFVIFLVYFFSGKLGLKLAFENASATAVWAPTGIALAAFLLRGYHVWPAILAGAFLINITTTGNIPTSALIAAGNTCEGLLGAYLVNKYAGGRFAFEKTSNIFRFVFLAGILSTALSATVGVTSLVLWDLAKWSSYISIWLTWWIGDAVGAFLLTPLVILWFQKKPFAINKKQALETAAVFLVLALVSVIEFTPFSIAATRNYPLSYILLPPFVWIAFRFDKRFISTAAFIVCAAAIWGTLNGYGPFVVPSLNDSLLFLQAFISIITIMTLAFASVIEEHHEIEKKAYNLMEEKVIERTDELRKTQAELIHSEKLASLGRFSAGIAHEIRNPLANISSLAQLLLKRNTNEETGKHLELINANSDIANNIIKDLLNIASPHNVNFKKASIASLLGNVCTYSEARCEKNNIVLISDIQAGIPDIMINESKIEAAFLNLISNAIDAMPEGGTLSVSVKLNIETREIVITFVDTGIGIPEKNMGNILEPFFTTKHDGTGLGLSLVYHVIRAHSGSIKFVSSVGRGTEFTIVLPVQNETSK